MNTMTRIDTALRHDSRLALPRPGHGQIDHLIDEALQLSPNVIGYYVSRRLAELFSDRALIEVMAGEFDLEEYAHSNL